jgi:hypothetical protein
VKEDVGERAETPVHKTGEEASREGATVAEAMRRRAGEEEGELCAGFLGSGGDSEGVSPCVTIADWLAGDLSLCDYFIESLKRLLFPRG